ncbi:MAG: peptidylprolyl isomerase [Methylocella sp.]
MGFKHFFLVFWVLLVLTVMGDGVAVPIETAPARESAPSPGSGVGGAVPAAKPPRVVMLKINGEEITVEDYVNFLQNNSHYVRLSMSPEGKTEVVRAVIANVLLREDIMRKSLLPGPEKPTAANLGQAYAKLAEQYFPLPPPPDEEAAYRFYLDHQGDYGIPEMARISQIQFRIPEGASEEQKASARKRAETALGRLEAGEPFARLAGELTENPQAKPPQGDLGFLPRARDPWLTKAVGGLKAGERTKVIESPVGYEILMVTDAREALISPYANVRDQVIQRVRAEAQATQRDAYVKELAKTAKIEIVQEELKALFPEGPFP